MVPYGIAIGTNDNTNGTIGNTLNDIGIPLENTRIVTEVVGFCILDYVYSVHKETQIVHNLRY